MAEVVSYERRLDRHPLHFLSKMCFTGRELLSLDGAAYSHSSGFRHLHWRRSGVGIFGQDSRALARSAAGRNVCAWFRIGTIEADNGRRWRSFIAYMRKRERELRSTIDISRGPYFSTVPGDDAMDGGQPHACAGKLAVGMEALEWPEQAVSIARIEAHAIVSNEVDGTGGLLGKSELDAGEFHSRRVFPRITQEILEH